MVEPVEWIATRSVGEASRQGGYSHHGPPFAGYATSTRSRQSSRRSASKQTSTDSGTQAVS